ncbi:hypothetical protein [Nonomuraea gerenzanensis]|uniref:Beta-lactamase class C and other penicillin binding proteins n=1 Tax=Nonomuraea gerenzanensis TaxID=93944 RepID=A0A1M4EEP8_9ACTN|nr:hypothetical protein [Nonomuraea gerenzanensis]UBU08701.1 hypothetical protein LCN96_30420 [Nonomuraea gerenzanensis]SBO97063.1 Beta-lactamase class C and other penicillin binding proteins [Nonomuraea gerenzanensis]
MTYRQASILAAIRGMPYHAFFRMLLNGGVHDGERIPSSAAVELMTTNRLTPEQLAARDNWGRAGVHADCGLGRHGGWSFGVAVRTYRDVHAGLRAGHPRLLDHVVPGDRPTRTPGGSSRSRHVFRPVRPDRIEIPVRRPASL